MSDREAARQVLLKAADYIVEHGKCSLAYDDNEGRVRAMGAIGKVAGYGRLYDKALGTFGLVIGLPMHRIIEWNNHPGVTKYHVAAKLRQAAATLADDDE